MWLCVIKQEAARLITALRPHCMMGAGRQVRVEHGTPTTPTHPPGYTQHQYDCLQYVSLCIVMLFFFLIDHCLLSRNEEEYDFGFDDEPSPSPQGYGGTPNPQTPGYPEVPSPQVNPQYNPQTPGTPAM